MKIEKCPFCGGEAKTSDTATDKENKFEFGWIGCQECCVFINYINNQRGKSEAIATWNRRAQPEITGSTSDGYHTFNELYHHRAMLFSVICNDRLDRAWKSKMHHDGTMYDGMFIVGIQTPNGQATYHYDIDPYWDMFRVPELPQAPEWDGHTSEQAIERIGRLTQPENNPLSLNELRQMDGEPVWIQLGDGDEFYALVSIDHGELGFISEYYDHDCPDEAFYAMYHDDKDGYFGLHVLGWRALRSKPKEEV